VAPNFSVIQSIKVFTTSTPTPLIPCMKRKATQDTAVYLCLFRHRGHMTPFPTVCSEGRLRTSPADVLPGGEQKTPGILQGKNGISSGSGRNHSEWCFPILLGRLALFWIKFNHRKEKKIKSRYSWDRQHLHLNLSMRSYNVG